MLRLFRPQIKTLLLARDCTIDAWQKQHPDRDVFEDRELEVTSEISIDIDAQAAAVDAALEVLGRPKNGDHTKNG
jgi:hypothetical protein